MMYYILYGILLVGLVVIEITRLKRRKALEKTLMLANAEIQTLENELEKTNSAVQILEQQLVDYAVLKKEYNTVVETKNKYYEKQTELANKYNDLTTTAKTSIDAKNKEIADLKAAIEKLKKDNREAILNLTTDNQKLAKMIDGVHAEIVKGDIRVDTEPKAKSTPKPKPANAELTCETVRSIKQDLKTMSNKAVAAKYNIPAYAVSKINTGRSYADC